MALALASCAGSRFRETNHEFVQSDECEPTCDKKFSENAPNRWERSQIGSARTEHRIYSASREDGVSV